MYKRLYKNLILLLILKMWNFLGCVLCFFCDMRNWCSLFDGEETRWYSTSCESSYFLMALSCVLAENGLCWSLHMDGLSTLSCTWVGRLLFRSIVLIFVELGGGSERPDICCSVLTCTSCSVLVSTEQHMPGRSLPSPNSTKINTMLRNNNLPIQV